MVEQGAIIMVGQIPETRAVRSLRMVWRIIAGLFALATVCAVAYIVAKAFYGYRVLLVPGSMAAALWLWLAMVALWLLTFLLLAVVLACLLVRLVRRGRLGVLGGLVWRLLTLLVLGAGIAAVMGYEGMRNLGDPSVLLAPRAALAALPAVFTTHENPALGQKLAPASKPTAAQELFLGR